MKARTGVLLLAGIAVSSLIAVRVHSQTPVTQTQTARTYVGSATCRGCYQPIYEGGSKTRMANVAPHPKKPPELVLPDFAKSDPLLTFKPSDVALVYGTKWKQ